MWELKISDKVVIRKLQVNFVVLSENEGTVINPRTNKEGPRKPDKKYYFTLYKAIIAALHIAVEKESPGSVQEYIKLLNEFRDEVLSAADFVEYKYKVVKVAP